MNDFNSFEKLASDVMLLEGWHDIIPLGSVHDLGRDAMQTSYHKSNTIQTTVFQYTLEKRASDKINRTVERLKEAGIKFNEFVFVTTEVISPKRSDDLKANFRKEYSATLHIYEHRTIANRLSDYSNGIFRRYFPDIKSQITDLENTSSLFNTNNSETEVIRLKSSIALVFGKGTTSTRKSLFDHMVFAVILSHIEGIEVEQIIHELKNASGISEPLQNTQIDSAIHRLVDKGKVKREGTKAIATASGLLEAKGLTLNAETQLSVFAEDIYAEVERVIRRNIKDSDHQKIYRNVQNSLASLVRAYGFELAARLINDIPSAEGQINNIDSIVSIAQHQLPKDIGDIVVSALADAIRAPSPNQAKTLAFLVRSYLAVAIMGLDPSLNELQVTRFGGKSFILDTDVVLDAIITERPISNTIQLIIKDLISAGSKIIIPPTVLDEVVQHAEISTRTNNYFRDSLINMSPGDVEVRVNNTFVAGFYYGKTLGILNPKMTFLHYRDNYFDSENPISFIKEVIGEVLGKELLFVEPMDIVGAKIPADKLEIFKNAMLDILSASNKAGYRTPDETENLAKADTELFLSSTYMNPEQEGKKKEVLGGKCYLVTKSLKYFNAARKAGMLDSVTTNPAALSGILSLIGTGTVNETEFIKLIHNPFLSDAIEKTWDDVQTLVKNGIDLKGISLPRLRWDLDKSFHSRISALYKEETTVTEVQSSDDAYLALVEDAHKKGYRLSPVVEAFRNKVADIESKSQSKEDALESLKESYTSLESQVDHYEKRKKKFTFKRK